LICLAAWLLAGLAYTRHAVPHWGLEGSKQRFRKFAWGTFWTVLVVVVSFVIPTKPTKKSMIQTEAPRTGTAFVADHDTYGWGVVGDPSFVGQRLDRVDPSRPKKILLLGDSIFVGHGVKKEESAAALLDRRYKDHQVLNASVSGYSIEQYYLVAQELVPRHKPDIVLVGLFAGNDYQVTMREFMWGHSKPLLEYKDGKLVRANQASACIDRLSRSAGMRFVHQSQDLSYMLTRLVCEPRFLTPMEGEQTIRAALEGIRRVTEENGGRVLFLMSLCRPEILLDRSFVRYLSKQQHLERLLAEKGHEAFALYPPLDIVPTMFLEDGCHYNPEGNIWVADALQKELERRYGVEPRTPAPQIPVADPQP